MSAGEVLFVCHGCGARVDAARALPFRCPAAVAGDDVDHVLVPELSPVAVFAEPSGAGDKPPRYGHSGPLAPSVASPDQLTPSVAPTDQLTPSLAPLDPFTPSVAPTDQLTPSVAPPDPFTPSVAPLDPVTPSVAPFDPFTPSVAPLDPVTPSVAPADLLTPSVAPADPLTPSVAPLDPLTPSVAPLDPVTPSVAPPQAARSRGARSRGARSRGAPSSLGGEQNPFLRYRALLSPYRLARAAGLPDQAWSEIVGQLDDAIAAVDGRGFRVTPLAEQPELARALGLRGELWVKDETGNVSGSHKARHLMGVMLHLRVLEAARLPLGADARQRRLAIASCGNAALAAAVVARAAQWPLDVFIPPDASPGVVGRLRDLEAGVTVCRRRPGEAGDPCFLRFREAVAGGAIPFGVQGTENGLAIEGGRTLAFEMAEGLRAAGAPPDALFVQVGGGALASALAQGFALAVAAGVLPRPPRLVAVQTAGCAPLARAWQRLEGAALADAARARSRFMWPWETVPASLAHGILDDETYDWWAIAEGMRATGGGAVVVEEGAVARAHELAVRHTGIAVSATGTAGLAGVLAAAAGDEPPPHGIASSGRTAVIFSGGER